MPIIKIECENCYFCTYKKPYKCQHDIVIQPASKHGFCGRFLDRDTGKSIQQILTESNNDAISNVKHDIDPLSDEKKKKLKEFIKNKIENKPL